MVIQLLGRAIYVYSIFLWPFYYFPLWKAVIFATIPIAFLNLLFMLNTQINHLTEHQVVTAQNFGCNSSFCFLFSGGMNFQIDHHLYPYVNHCRSPSLAPKVKAFCKKHYNETAGYGNVLQMNFAHTKNMSHQPSLMVN
jgi:delta11-fatty-acid desaturase